MMVPIEEVLRELEGEDVNEQGLPPGFRFHPTDEELITFYLASKVFNGTFCGVQIAEVDLNRCEPWELPDVAKMGEREWYFFSLRDRKYPTGLRTNRATGAGYWKATGKDREVYSASNGALLGMKKTLVFYKGRAPRGLKTKWVMHEYRLAGDFSYRISSKEEWVICRIYHKSVDKKISILHDQEAAVTADVLSPRRSSNSTQLPPLLESPSTRLPEYEMMLQQNPFVIRQQENDVVKSQINAVMSQSNYTKLFPINGFQFQFQAHPSISSLNKGPSSDYNYNHNYNYCTSSSSVSGSSMLIKSLLSHQDCNTIKESTGTCSSSSNSKTEASIPKQCKTEANFYHFEMLNPSLHCWEIDNIHHHHHHHQPNPLFFDMDGNNTTIITNRSSSLMGSSPAAGPHQMSTSFAFNRATLPMMLDQPMTISEDSSCPLDL